MGVTCLVSPNMIGGLRIASELVRPQVVSFLDRMLRSKSEAGVRVEEVVVPAESAWVGKTLEALHEKTGVLVISYHDPEQRDFVYNPGLDEQIRGGMALVFIATPEKRKAMEEAVLGKG